MPGRVVAHRLVDELVEAGELDDLVEALDELLAGHAEDRAVEEDVLAARQVGVEAGAELEQRRHRAVDARPCPRRGRGCRTRHFSIVDLPLPLCPTMPNASPWSHLERDVLEGPEVLPARPLALQQRRLQVLVPLVEDAEPLREVLDRDGHRHGRARLSVAPWTRLAPPPRLAPTTGAGVGIAAVDDVVFASPAMSATSDEADADTGPTRRRRGGRAGRGHRRPRLHRLERRAPAGRGRRSGRRGRCAGAPARRRPREPRRSAGRRRRGASSPTSATTAVADAVRGRRRRAQRRRPGEPPRLDGATRSSTSTSTCAPTSRSSRRCAGSPRTRPSCRRRPARCTAGPATSPSTRTTRRSRSTSTASTSWRASSSTSCTAPATACRTTVLRLTNVYGPRQHLEREGLGFLPVFVRRALLGEEIVLFGDGIQRARLRARRRRRRRPGAGGGDRRRRRARSSTSATRGRADARRRSPASTQAAAGRGGGVRRVPWPRGAGADRHRQLPGRLLEGQARARVGAAHRVRDGIRVDDRPLPRPLVVPLVDLTRRHRRFARRVRLRRLGGCSSRAPSCSATRPRRSSSSSCRRCTRRAGRRATRSPSRAAPPACSWRSPRSASGRATRSSCPASPRCRQRRPCARWAPCRSRSTSTPTRRRSTPTPPPAACTPRDAGDHRRPPVRPAGAGRAAAGARHPGGGGRRPGPRRPRRRHRRGGGVLLLPHQERRRHRRRRRGRDRRRASSPRRIRRLRAHGMTDQYVHVDDQPEPRHERAGGGVAAPAAARSCGADNARRRGASRGATATRRRSSRWQADHADHVFHQCVARVADRERFAPPCPTAGSRPAVHYPLTIGQQPAYRRFSADPCPDAEAWAAGCVSLPCFPELTRRRGRPRRRGAGGRSASDACATRRCAHVVRVLPLLQRRAGHPEDGPRRSPRLARQRRAVRDHRRRRRLRRRLARRARRAPATRSRAAHRASTGRTAATAAPCISGFAAATEEWVFYTDGDAQYDASEITALHRRRPARHRHRPGVQARTRRLVVPQGDRPGLPPRRCACCSGCACATPTATSGLIRRDLVEPVELVSTSGRDLRRDDVEVPAAPAPASPRSASATTNAPTVARSSSASRRSPARRASCSGCGGRWWPGRPSPGGVRLSEDVLCHRTSPWGLVR